MTGLASNNFDAKRARAKTGHVKPIRTTLSVGEDGILIIPVGVEYAGIEEFGPSSRRSTRAELDF